MTLLYLVKVPFTAVKQSLPIPPPPHPTLVAHFSFPPSTTQLIFKIIKACYVLVFNLLCSAKATTQMGTQGGTLVQRNILG